MTETVENTTGSQCEKCGARLAVGVWPFCPHGRGAHSVQGDEIDFTTSHITGQPERFRSRERLRQRMREHGLVHAVRHVDGSKETSRWG